MVRSGLYVAVRGEHLRLGEERRDSFRPVVAGEEADEVVQDDLKRVHGELILAPHAVHEFEVDVAAGGVVQREEGPAIGVGRESLEHLLHVGHFQVAGGQPVPVDARRQEVLDGCQDSLLDAVQGVLAFDLDAEDQIQVSVLHGGTRRRFGVVAHHVRRSAAVHAHVLDVDVEAAAAGLDGSYQVHQADGEVGEVVVAVDLHVVVQDREQLLHLAVIEGSSVGMRGRGGGRRGGSRSTASGPLFHDDVLNATWRAPVFRAGVNHLLARPGILAEGCHTVWSTAETSNTGRTQAEPF